MIRKESFKFELENILTQSVELGSLLHFHNIKLIFKYVPKGYCG